MRIKKIIEIVLTWICIVWTVCLTANLCSREVTATVDQRVDTVVIRDTIRDTVLVPRTVYLARVDTVMLRLPGDTVYVAAEVPVVRKEYFTEDYYAVVEGFRPALVTMELYPQTHLVTHTRREIIRKKQRLGIGVQMGYGLTGDKKLQPYVGIGLQFSVWGF